MFRTLFCPVDGSPSSENALPFALSIAARSSAALHIALVHVPEAYGEASEANWGDLDAEAQESEEKYLAALYERLSEVSSARIVTHRLEGIVPETLTAEINQRNVDLVVINAHGWGYISRAVVGSVSDYLMRHLQVPLLVVHAPSEASEGVVSRPVAVRRVLIPLDGSPMAETILPPARSLGQLWQAEYRLLRVVQPPGRFMSWNEEPPAAQQSLQSAMEDNAATYLDGLAERLRSESLKVDTQVTVAHSPAKAILDEARNADCDVIAIATHGRGGLPRLLWGSVADKVIRGAPTPVLVCNASPVDAL